MKGLSTDELLQLADKALNLFVSASFDPKTKSLAEQRINDLNVIQKNIRENRESKTEMK